MIASSTHDRAPFLVDEYGRLVEVALCRPEHYDWAAENAIAHASTAAGLRCNRAAARRQHDGLVATLESAGVTCRFLPTDPHLPMQTFTRDSGVMTPWGLLVTRMARPERHAEWTGVVDLAAEHHLPIWRRVTAAPVEGGDVQVLRPGELAVGVNGVRTFRAGAEQLAGWVRTEGWELRTITVPAHFLHLDVLFCSVSADVALCATEILTADDVAWLSARFELIPVGYRDVMRMGCNVTALGDGRVLSAAQNDTVNDRLRSLGFEVFAPDLEQFVLEGGATHCLTMPLRRHPAPA